MTVIFCTTIAHIKNREATFHCAEFRPSVSGTAPEFMPAGRGTVSVGPVPASSPVELTLGWTQQSRSPMTAAPLMPLFGATVSMHWAQSAQIRFGASVFAFSSDAEAHHAFASVEAMARSSTRKVPITGNITARSWTCAP
jgi:hypothetical protein